MSNNKVVKQEPKEESIPDQDESQTQQPIPRKPRRFKVCLLFQQSEVGPIIGKGGAMIKSIKEKSGCDLNFYDLYQRNRTLVILGEKTNIPTAIELVCEALRDDEMKSSNDIHTNSGEANNEKTSRVSIFWILQRDHAISLIGKEGANAKRVKEETQGAISVLFGEDQTSPELLVRLTGSPNEISNAILLCITEFIRDSKNGKISHRPSSLLDSSRGRLLTQTGRGFRYTNSKYRGPEQFKIESTQSIQLSRDLTGAVIGKGGGNITRIRNISNATIKINTPENESENATVVVVGRPSAVAIAFELIEECIQIFLAHGVRLKTASGNGNGEISARSVTASGKGQRKQRGNQMNTSSLPTIPDNESKENVMISHIQ